MEAMLPTDERRLQLLTDGPRPLFVVWEVTLRCDQHCRFCGSAAGKPGAGELTTAEALDVVPQLAVLGTAEVTLHGGEAYLRPDWLELVRAIRAQGIACTLVTGGRRFDAALAREAKAAGLSAASVSIDGTHATHDDLRGPGSFDAAFASLRHLRDAGVPVGCNTQINRRNFGELEALFELLAAVPIYGWQVQLMIPMGRAADAEDLWLQPYDLLEVIPLVAKARERCDAAGIPLWPGNNVGYFGPYEHVLREGRSRFGFSTGCGGGIRTMGIAANGDIKACSAMATAGHVGGNVRERSIRDIWDHAPELRFSRDFTVDDLWGACRSCYYAEYCKGGCMWTSAAVLGRRGNDPYCHHRALELQARGKRERLVRTAPTSGHDRATARLEILVEDAPSATPAAGD